jgi:propionyl-CoA synthetase
MNKRSLDELRGAALQDPASFWSEAAGQIDWYKTWDKVLDTDGNPCGKWFAGAETNTCFNALDRHIEQGFGDQCALIHDSPVTDAITRFTYRELRDSVAKFAGVLRDLGVSKGDRVVIYMPVIPETVVAMLACARLGAVHTVVFGGFAGPELANRIRDAAPKALVCASCGIESNRIVPYKPAVDEAVRIAEWTGPVIVLQRPQCAPAMDPKQDHDWRALMASATPADCVAVGANEPLYILYTSGTTGQPKGIVRETGGHMVALQWTMRNIYNATPGEVYWAASDVGWVVGHSYMVYGPLLNRCTTLLYEGKPVGTPDAGAFWRVIQEHRVSTMFTAPTAIRAIKKEDPQGLLCKSYDTSSLKALFLAGERCDPTTIEWSGSMLNVPVVDHWWQTETGWAIAATPLGLEAMEVKIGSAGKPMPGWDVRCIDDSGVAVKPGDVGAIACALPLPPGVSTTLWNAPERYTRAYLERYPGYYETGDAGLIDEDGYVHVMTRTDDVINVAGHRLSTGAIEEVIASHPDVAECAVVGMADPLKGQIPLGLIVLNSAARGSTENVLAEITALVRSRLGAVVAFKTAVVVPRLPKTRSGKLLRGVIQKMADGKEYKAPPTIDDPAALTEVHEHLKQAGVLRELNPAD